MQIQSCFGGDQEAEPAAHVMMAAQSYANAAKIVSKLTEECAAAWHSVLPSGYLFRSLVFFLFGETVVFPSDAQQVNLCRGVSNQDAYGSLPTFTLTAQRPVKPSVRIQHCAQAEVFSEMEVEAAAGIASEMEYESAANGLALMHDRASEPQICPMLVGAGGRFA